MDKDAFKKLLLEELPEQFIEDQLFDRVPYVFGDDRTGFIKWKRELGKRIDVDPACIAIVGSGATGFSMNPHKNFKPFDDDSDVDVAIISSLHFSIGWRYLRMNKKIRYKLPERMRNAWDDHVKKYIYWGTLATDHLLGIMPFGRQWLRAGSYMSLHDLPTPHTVNFRIYTDYDALREYHVQGASKLQASIQSYK
jgi:hypothetical protein